jgi:hypothetical protein
MPDNSPPIVAAIAQAANPTFSRWFGLDIHKQYLWETIRFGQSHRERIEALLATMAAKDEAAILLQQLPRFGIITAMTVLGAIGADSLYKFANEVGKDNLGGLSALEFTRHQLDELGIGSVVTQITKNAAGKRVILPPSRHDPNAVIEPKRKTRGGVTDYPPFGCASIKAKPDPRTREARLLNGRSKPEGAKKKRPLVGPKKKVAIPTPTA